DGSAAGIEIALGRRMKPVALSFLFGLFAGCAVDPTLAKSDRAVTPPAGARIVDTVEELTGALNDSTFRGTIFIPNGVTLNLTGLSDLPLHEGVTLMGGRSGTDEGATLFAPDLG